MSRTARTIIGLIVLVLIVVLIGLVYIWVSGGSAAPSATLSAPTLDISTPLPTTAPTAVPTIVTAEATSSSASATESISATVEAASTVVSASTAQATAAANTAPSSLTIFSIDSTQSQVQFILNEVLRGSSNKVTGTTDQVAGQIGVDFTNPQNSQVGEIRIDARSLSTDNELRNRAIRGQILQSSEDQFEFISFKPTSIDGLPTSVAMGKSFEFHVTGDLTIRDITKPVTFDVTVTPDSQTEIKGTATATVQRGDYNLIIPNVPGVADVDEAVNLQIDFVATQGTAAATPSS